MTAHSLAAGNDLHEDKRVKQPVRAASTANVTTSSPGATMDGVTLSNGDRVLLKDQSTASQNGVYVWSGSTSTLQRTSDAASATDFVFGFKVYVREGTLNGTTYWTFSQSSAVTIGSTSLTFIRDAAGPTQSSTAPAVASSGTISTAGLSVSRVAPAGAVTGVILQAGSLVGQDVWVINESTGANSITFAVAGTSNVADGASSAIAGLTARRFVWDNQTALWYRAA